MCVPAHIDFGVLVDTTGDVGDAHVSTSAIDLQFFNGSPDIIEVLDVFSTDQNLTIEFFPSIVPPYSYLYIAQVAFKGIL